MDVTVGGNGDKDLMRNMQRAAEDTVRRGFDEYRRGGIQKDVAAYLDDPHARG
ncbi:hypothetical protein LXM94_23635 [Rhizobium sp. TRM95111]|uniref:hypothetical protein n=1 Tax=Rhizobium alarense TaxID=2846851 RepID=UPI001F1B6625|nr:hypothetical protein [Rhizobium alarense]MCF3642960.1 hypothetical protein [Rhizobium alarense]